MTGRLARVLAVVIIAYRHTKVPSAEFVRNDCAFHAGVGAADVSFNTIVIFGVVVFQDTKVIDHNGILPSLYKHILISMLGLRQKRNIAFKEVIIEDPKYLADAEMLKNISIEVDSYAHEHKLWRLPNPVKVFFRYEADHEIERIVEVLEGVIEDLQNTRDKKIITVLNNYPVVSPRAHTRVFNRQWLNILSAILLPVGICIYIRMWMFRLRLYRDLKVIKNTNSEIVQRIEEIT